MGMELAAAPHFQRARTNEQIAQRREEIIEACAQLFRDGGLDAVSFTAISEMTSIKRQALYKYYASREEVLLDLLKREQKSWEQTIYRIVAAPGEMTREEFAAMMTDVFIEYSMMLRLTSLLFDVLEDNCRLEKLVEFRTDNINVYQLLFLTVRRYFPRTPVATCHEFTHVVFAYVVGLFPMNNVTEKFLEAERQANAYYVYPETFSRENAFRDSCYRGILYLTAPLE